MYWISWYSWFAYAFQPAKCTSALFMGAILQEYLVIIFIIQYCCSLFREFSRDIFKQNLVLLFLTILKFLQKHGSRKRTSLTYYLGKGQWWANFIKWTQTNIPIHSDATLCTERISKYIQMQHISWMNIWINLYSGNSMNTNTNSIRGSFYSNIQIFVPITD